MRALRRLAMVAVLAVAMLVTGVLGAFGQSPTPSPSASGDLPTSGPGPSEAAGTAGGGAGKQVTLWEGTWNSVKINTEIAAFILEHGYGYQVEQVDVSASLMQQALLDGRIDANLELWCINREQFCNDNFGEGGPLEMLSPIYQDSEQGWYVPRYVVEGEDAPAPDLSSVSQLAEYADLFEDPANPGKGRLISGVSGWAITKANNARLHAYGLADAFTAQTVGSQAALDSAIVGAIQQQKPFVAYYWTPTWIMGKYDLVKLDEPAYSQACEDALDAAVEQGPPFDDVGQEAACAYETTDIRPGIVADLRDRAPEAVQLIDRMDVGLEPIAQASARMKSEGLSSRESAIAYLQEHADRWKSWVPPEVAQKVEQAIAEEDEGTPASIGDWFVDFPSAVVPLESWTSDAVAAFTSATGAFFGAIADALTFVIAKVQQGLLWLPWIVIVGAVAALAWWVGDWKLALGSAAGLTFLGLLGVWDESMQTLALIVFATAVSVGVGVPLGIWAGRSDRVDGAVRPFLDFMQTMPAFVYLVPAVILFSIGQVPALMATIIYATPPVVRLTNHGIRQVPAETVEAAHAFGSTPRQVLRKVQLPLAFPTIMKGVNQTVMLALAMVVLASFVGAEGLGRPVLDGLQNLNVGLAFVGGLGIVVLAMIIDRITQAAGGTDREAAA